MGLGLANHDLHSLGPEMAASLETSTRVAQWFGCSNVPDIQRLMMLSGEMLEKEFTYRKIGELYALDGITERERRVPRLGVNEISRMNDNTRNPLSVIHVRRGGGYARFGGLPIVGEHSHFIKTYRFLSKALPDVKPVLLPGGEHFGPLEQPELLANEILDFLTRTEAADPTVSSGCG